MPAVADCATCLDLRLAVTIVAVTIRRRYGNHTYQLLENFVPRRDQWVPLSPDFIE
jgi:hypothetical protein